MHNKMVDFNNRNGAIDLLRAFTMLLMIFVNDFWTITAVPQWMGHAQSTADMMGFSDTIFPAFLFVVGMSIPYAVERRFNKGLSGLSTVEHIFMRSLALLIMGAFTVNTESGIDPQTGFSAASFKILMVLAIFLVWNVYPYTNNILWRRVHATLKIIGLLVLVYLAFIFRDAKGGAFSSRWWGILGLIGWTYLVCAMLYLFFRNKTKILVLSWVAFITICMLKTNRIADTAILNLKPGNFLDRLMGIFNMGNGAHLALTMGGILLSLFSARYTKATLFKKGSYATLIVIVFLCLGYLSNKVYIISKIQATPPWVFYCTGISVAFYALFYGLVEKGKAHWFNGIKTAGTATLTCYLLPYVVYSIVELTGLRFPVWIATGMAGLLKCLIFSLAIIGLTHLLGKWHIKLKI